jgi:hypothetical protein
MFRAMRRAFLAITGGLATAGAIAFVVSACSASTTSAESTTPTFEGGATDSSSPFGDSGAISISVNGVFLVHAASFPGFRLCFEANDQALPTPNADLMPNSNVVGVDIGTAVRIEPLSKSKGRVFAFPEPSIRTLYNSAGVGPTCKALLGSSSQVAKDAIEVADLDEDLSRDVHLLVLTGCRPQAKDPSATTARCGSTWTAATGNLTLKHIGLGAYKRSSTRKLPIQVVQLSTPLATATGNQSLGLAFGDLAGAVPSPLISGDFELAKAFPSTPAEYDYDPDDSAAYGSTGFFLVSPNALDGGADAGGSKYKVLLTQSLADIQSLSAPRSLPDDWYSAGSSYVLLVLGETGGDAGPDAAFDQRRELHFLAVPLAGSDAGTDGGGTTDGGSSSQ